MAFITTGLTKNAQGKEGVTAHYNFSYHSSFAGPGGPEPARTNAVIAACENDYNLMSEWFGGSITITGIDVQVTTPTNQFCNPPPAGGACWNSSLTVQLIAQGNDPIYLRYLLIAEVTEIFMQRQNAGWFQGSTEGSKGEALSRFLSTQFLLLNDLASMPYPGFNVAFLWLNPPSARHDFVNNNPDDNKPDPVTGCTTLYLYYLHDQLGFPINAIIAAGASNLSGVYQNLVGESDGWTPFIRLVDSHYPQQSAAGVHFIYNPPGDSIFPVAELSAFFPPNQITCGYSEPAQVFIDRPVVAEVNIELTSDDPSVVQVPPVATIPTGSLSTSVDVTTTALPIPFPPKFVSIRATYAGKTLTTSVEVVPPAVARVALSPDTVVSGSSSSGTVILNRPSRLGAVVVDVSSSAPGIATVSPTQVIIPQGSQSATFVITARDSAVPFRTAHAEITATYSGSSASARLTVKSSVVAGTLASLTLFPSTVTGGHTSRGTVRLERAVATDTLVGLAAVEGTGSLPLPSHSSLVARVPQSVLIRAGETNAFFTITTGEILPHTTRRVAIMAWAIVQKSEVLSITG